MVPPWRINDVIDRAEEGPICFDKDFETKIMIPKLAEVIKKYEISYDHKQVISDDDSLADRAWKAAMEFYLEVGTLAVGTHRRLLFTEDEVKEAMYLLPGRISVGEGKDAREIIHRGIGDNARMFFVGSPSVPCTEEIFVPLVCAFMQEPILDGVGGGSLETVMGRRFRTGSPLEMQAGVAHGTMIREAARKVGRPGIYLADVQSAVSDAAQFAAGNADWGVRYTDGRMVGSISELKISEMELSKMAQFHQWGFLIMALFTPIFGGVAGGAEGTLVMSLASHIQGLMVNQGHIHVFYPFHIVYNCGTTRELVWVRSVSHQAISRNTKLLSLDNSPGAAGPCTEMVLYESACVGVEAAVSGAAGTYVFFSGRGAQFTNRNTPLEARMNCEAALAAQKMGLKRDEANELIDKILRKYEDKFRDAPLGRTFEECWDVRKLRPTSEYKDIYTKVKKDLVDMGLEFPY